MKRFLPGLMFLLMGILALVLSIHTLTHEGKGYLPTTGVIDHIDKVFTGLDDDGHEEYDYEVYVNYTVDGKAYTSLSNFYAPDYEAGKEIKIFYDPADPSRIVGDSKGFMIYTIVIGAVLSLIGLFSIVRRALSGR